MRSGISITVSETAARRLRSVVADPKTPQKHVWRARIILLTADGLGTNAIMVATAKSKTTVWRWQERFMEAGVDGLLSDKTRPPGKAPVAEDQVARVIRLTQDAPPGETTHWTSRAMAKATGLGVTTVQRIWKAHGLAPHRWRAFKLSKDPAFTEKLHDIVGLYVSPPAHAVVLSVDEKSQIQALDRTQPGLPMKKGRAATMTHDYKRHGTTTLFAALNTLTGEVFAKNMSRHRHQEFIRFLNALERENPRRQGRPCDLGQLRRAQDAGGPPLARPPSTLDLPLHPDIEFLAERRRGLLRQALAQTAQARRLLLRRGATGCHQPLHRGAQRGAQAIRLARRSKRNHCRQIPRVPSVGIRPLGLSRIGSAIMCSWAPRRPPVSFHRIAWAGSEASKTDFESL